MKKEHKENYRQLLIDKIVGLVEQRAVTIGTIKTSYLLCGNRGYRSYPQQPGIH